MDELSEQYRELLYGSYDCVDRIVLNAYNPLCHSPGGFRSCGGGCTTAARGSWIPRT
jgi:hypothetical protein